MGSDKRIPILVVAGEPSGDKNGALLIREVLQRTNRFKFIGWGGPKMQETGADVEDITHQATVGLFELHSKVAYYRKLLKRSLNLVKEKRIKYALLIDFPGFNLYLAKLLKRRRVKIFYYIVPQIWAWGNWRWKELKKYVDVAMCILPFEEKFLAKKGIKSFYVGHPLLAQEKINVQKKKQIAFLPGSREQEIKRLLPVMIDLQRMLKKKLPYYDFVLSLISDNIKIPVEYRSEFKIFQGEAQFLLAESKGAIVASGTASLEAGLIGIPFLVVYKLSLPTYLIGRLLVKVQYASLVNLLLQKRKVPEFIQFLNPGNITNTFLEILNQEEKYLQISKNLKNILSIRTQVGIYEILDREVPENGRI